MTGPREWRHAGDCAAGWAHTRTCWYPEGRCHDGSHPCSCGLSAVRDAIAVGHLAPVGLTEAERERQDREGLTVEPLPPLYHCYVDPDGVLTLWRAYFDNRLRAQSRYVLEQQHLDVVAERDTLREALRIAVEGLDRVERWYVCKNVPDDDGDFITCRGFTDDSTGWCGWCSALDAIEQVNRLVDLRPVVEGDGSGHVLPPFDPNVERMDEL